MKLVVSTGIQSSFTRALNVCGRREYRDSRAPANTMAIAAAPYAHHARWADRPLDFALIGLPGRRVRSSPHARPTSGATAMANSGMKRLLCRAIARLSAVSPKRPRASPSRERSRRARITEARTASPQPSGKRGAGIPPPVKGDCHSVRNCRDTDRLPIICSGKVRARMPNGLANLAATDALKRTKSPSRWDRGSAVSRRELMAIARAVRATPIAINPKSAPPWRLIQSTISTETPHQGFRRTNTRGIRHTNRSCVSRLGRISKDGAPMAALVEARKKLTASLPDRCRSTPKRVMKVVSRHSYIQYIKDSTPKAPFHRYSTTSVSHSWLCQLRFSTEYDQGSIVGMDCRDKISLPAAR